MRFFKLLIILIFPVTVLSGGTSVFSEEVRNVETEAQIQFIPSNEEIIVIPPEITEPPVIIPPTVPGTTGPLTISYAPNFNFGEQEISNQNQTYSMIAEMHELSNSGVGTGEFIPYTSFTQVSDTRGTNQGWKLSVTASEFTSDTQNNLLTGAQITLLNPRIQYEGNNQNNAPIAHGNELGLIPNESSLVMVAEIGKGALVSSVVWGNQTEIDAQFKDENFNPQESDIKNDAIKLFVPGSTVKDATSYEAVLTWELSLTPGMIN